MLYVSVSKLLPAVPTSALFRPTLKANPFIPLLLVNLSTPTVIASVPIFLNEEIFVSPILPTAILPSLQKKISCCLSSVFFSTDALLAVIFSGSLFIQEFNNGLSDLIAVLKLSRLLLFLFLFLYSRPIIIDRPSSTSSLTATNLSGSFLIQ